ncbi:MAG TPA: lysophospholipid acyltransferase family protein [Aggregatilineales bacterium]|nr:1-acyl-sn-glycerol-3-phosphate acyltransferase [Anaerolineales bacterium]HRE48891.1 lysophospholipid acyltransferase family protein [Aggregatilineales bacterium]
MASETRQITLMQAVMRAWVTFNMTTLLRMNVAGEKNIPTRGPLIVAANHLSGFDGAIVGNYLPPDTEYAAPGDFRLLFPGNLIVAWSRTIRVKRAASLELDAVRRMTDILKGGGILVIFPEGGTWEKPITDAKTGTVYLSMITQTPILPVGIGGVYRIWGDVYRLRRPEVSLTFGEVIPPIPTPFRAERDAVLEEATHDLMRRIYRLLPGPDQQWYDTQERRRYDVWTEVWRGSEPKMTNLPGRAALGEFMSKPNLLNPFIKNAGLPLDPLRYPGTRFPPATVKLAIRSLKSTQSPSLRDYLEYRLGVEKTRDISDALEGLMGLANDPAVTGITLKPTTR